MSAKSPVIAFASPKGGVGKTTATLTLAGELIQQLQRPVTIIDADPNRPIRDWAEGGNAPLRLTVVSDVEEDTIDIAQQ